LNCLLFELLRPCRREELRVRLQQGQQLIYAEERSSPYFHPFYDRLHAEDAADPLLQALLADPPAEPTS
jgi:hypothetical protein